MQRNVALLRQFEGTLTYLEFLLQIMTFFIS